MLAGTYNFELEQGSAYSRIVKWTDEDDNLLNMDGYDAIWTFRRSTYEGEVVFNLSIGNGLTLVPVDDGEPSNMGLLVSLTALQTATAPLTTLVHALKITSPEGEPIRLLEGVIDVSPDPTA